jgi:hypothetical protein
LVHLVVSFVVSDKQLFAPLIGITFCQRYPAQPLRDSLFASHGQSWTVYRLILCLYGTAFALVPTPFMCCTVFRKSRGMAFKHQSKTLI